MTLSDRIKHVRGDLTQKEFAVKLGLSLGAVQHWEIDNTPPSGNALIKIREIFRINLNWLLTGEGDAIDKTNQIDLPSSSNVIELQHMALVRGFRDKQRGLSINQNLIELETLDAESFNHIDGYIRGTVDSLKRVLSKMEEKKQDDVNKNGDLDDRHSRPVSSR